MGKDTGMKMKMLEDQAEYYDYLDDEVWVYLYRFNMVLFWHQFLQRDEHITLELILNLWWWFYSISKVEIKDATHGCCG